MGANQSFYTVIQTSLDEKKLSLFELSKLSNIPEGSLRRVVERGAGSSATAGRHAAPYVRGILLKIAPHLGLDGNDLWTFYQSEHETHVSGPRDALPINRYALKIEKRWPWIAGAAIAGLIVLYILVNGARLLGTPTLAVEYPPDDSIVVADPHIVIRGTLADGDAVFINTEPVELRDDGSWSAEYTVEPGLTTFDIKATRFLGKEAHVTRQVIYEKSATTTGR